VDTVCLYKNTIEQSREQEDGAQLDEKELAQLAPQKKGPNEETMIPANTFLTAALGTTQLCLQSEDIAWPAAGATAMDAARRMGFKESPPHIRRKRRGIVSIDQGRGTHSGLHRNAVP
jgi:hypothetical protein